MTQEQLHTFRPIKPLAVFFTFVAFILAIVAVAGTYWVDVAFEDQKLSWGLWEDCLTFDGSGTSKSVCVSKDWMSASGAFVVIAVIVSFCAMPLGIMGICTKTTTMYIIAGILDIFGSICMFIASIVYPVMFNQDMKSNGSSGWEFDWTYGIGWGALFFMVGAGILFLLKIPEHQVTTRQSKHIYINGAM